MHQIHYYDSATFHEVLETCGLNISLEDFAELTKNGYFIAASGGFTVLHAGLMNRWIEKSTQSVFPWTDISLIKSVFSSEDIKSFKKLNEDVNGMVNDPFAHKDNFELLKQQLLFDSPFGIFTDAASCLSDSAFLAFTGRGRLFLELNQCFSQIASALNTGDGEEDFASEKTEQHEESVATSEMPRDLFNTNETSRDDLKSSERIRSSLSERLSFKPKSGEDNRKSNDRRNNLKFDHFSQKLKLDSDSDKEEVSQNEEPKDTELSSKLSIKSRILNAGGGSKLNSDKISSQPLFSSNTSEKLFSKLQFHSGHGGLTDDSVDNSEMATVVETTDSNFDDDRAADHSHLFGPNPSHQTPKIRSTINLFSNPRIGQDRYSDLSGEKSSDNQQDSGVNPIGTLDKSRIEEGLRARRLAASFGDSQHDIRRSNQSSILKRGSILQTHHFPRSKDLDDVSNVNNNLAQNQKTDTDPSTLENVSSSRENYGEMVDANKIGAHLPDSVATLEDESDGAFETDATDSFEPAKEQTNDGLVDFSDLADLADLAELADFGEEQVKEKNVFPNDINPADKLIIKEPKTDIDQFNLQRANLARNENWSSLADLLETGVNLFPEGEKRQEIYRSLADLRIDKLKDPSGGLDALLLAISEPNCNIKSDIERLPQVGLLRDNINRYSAWLADAIQDPKFADYNNIIRRYFSDADAQNNNFSAAFFSRAGLLLEHPEALQEGDIASLIDWSKKGDCRSDLQSFLVEFDVDHAPETLKLSFAYQAAATLESFDDMPHALPLFIFVLTYADHSALAVKKYSTVVVDTIKSLISYYQSENNHLEVVKIIDDWVDRVPPSVRPEFRSIAEEAFARDCMQQDVITHYKEALDDQPKNIHRITRLSQVYANRGKAHDAVSLLREAYKTVSNSERPAILLQLASIAENNVNQPDTALEYYKQINNIAPCVESHKGAARLYHQRADWKGVIDSINFLIAHKEEMHMEERISYINMGLDAANALEDDNTYQTFVNAMNDV